MTVLLVVLLGLAWGSFLNVVICRIDNLRSIFRQRSHCPYCQSPIRWYDNIPLLSFVILRGRCRDCGKRISWQYPLVELVTAILFWLIWRNFGISWLALILALYFSALLVIAVYDLKTMLVVSEFAYLAIALAVIYQLVQVLTGRVVFSGEWLGMWLLGMAILGGIPAILVFYSREKWMGIGDILVGVTAGTILGGKLSLVALALAFVIGALVALALVAGQIKKFKDKIAFAPFLILGTLIAFFWGEFLLNWYLEFCL